jgi:hypothetical protein
MNIRRSRLYRQRRARPRLFIATLVAVAVGLWLPDSLVDHQVIRLLIAWNIGTFL